MTANLTAYVENADSISNGDAAFTLQNGKASSLYYLLASDAGGNVSTADVYTAITQILGSVSSEVGDGRLSRNLPLAHPMYSYLFASAVNIKGMGQGYKFPGTTGTEAPPFPNMTAYPNYMFHVEFTPRPYIVAPDSAITLSIVMNAGGGGGNFYDENGIQQSAPIASEWVRYTDWWYERKFESITCRAGQMVFKTNNASPPDRVPFSDMPRLFMPDSVLKMVWYQVPYRYLTSANSYLDYYGGYINQNAWMNWQPGELLYMGYKPIRYTPPVQGLAQVNTGSSGLIFSSEKWCDIELTFLRTKRRLASAAEKYGSLSNPNWLQAGHNLLPWAGDRKFHYATTPPIPPSTDPQTPIWPSFEAGLLFTDPDAKGAYQLPT